MPHSSLRSHSISACVNSTDPTATACANLFIYTGTQTVGSSANVFAAAINIAANPTVNVGNLYTLAGAAPPFQPTLASAPGDWTLGT